MISVGMDRNTGKALALQSDAHLAQSVNDILSSQIGERVMLRDYGSDNPNLVDQPLNDLTRQRLFASSALALQRWEPRARLRRMALQILDAGQAVLRLGLVRVDVPRPYALTVDFNLALTSALPSTALVGEGLF